MKILVIGSGGREHALVWKIRQSPLASEVFCAPGNPGIESLARVVPVKASDLPGLLAFAESNAIDLTVVGPEQPLADGVVDLFEAHDRAIFGPSKRAAELEWSKAFAKDFMLRHQIPTAAYRTFGVHERHEATAYLEGGRFPVVLKADGLAAGKGVIVCENRKQALETIHQMIDAKTFGSAAERIVIEEYMEGEEASVFAISDGNDYVTLVPAQDHKRVFDGDRGKNTGGMGAYAPTPLVTGEVLKRVERTIIEPTIRGMAAEARPYCGCLYVGLMLTDDGPKVVEYNSRFGDPETQVVLPLYDGDLVELLSASAAGGIRQVLRPTALSSGHAVCVVLASGGYPDAYPTGLEITGLEDVGRTPGEVVFHAGTKVQEGKIVTAGGRVLGVTAVKRSGSLSDAISAAYAAVSKITFQGMHYRRDIGKKALVN